MASPVAERIASASIRQSLNRILVSKEFQRAATLRRFLTYVVESALAGRGAELKEFTLGTAVFGRGENFDCRLDPIVRVQARKLRVRLRRYYASEGSGDPVRIDLPKGAYTPVFEFSAPADSGQPVGGTTPLPDAGTPVLSDDRILRLVGLIYDAAQAPQRWPDFLEALAGTLRSETTVLLAHDYEHAQTNVVTGVRFDPAYQRDFDEYYSKINPWTLGGRQYLAPGVVFTGQMACPDEALKKSEFYNDYLRRLHLFHSLGGTILKRGNRGAFVSSVRSKRAGPFGGAEIGLLRLLLPHLNRALDLHRTLVLLEGERDASAGALDALPYGCVLLDGKGKVLRANRAAMDILRRNDGLNLAGGCLATAGGEQSAQLERLVREAARTALGTGFSPGGTMSIRRPSGRSSYLVAVSPMPSGTLVFGERLPIVTVFVSDPEAEPVNRDETIRGFFGLTQAEARLASVLLDGCDAREAAERLAISHNTAKTHIRRIFEKTGTDRQSALVRLLLSTPALPARAGLDPDG